jgi:hypothetical protein
VNIPSPRIGFFGVIDERFDIDLLKNTAEVKTRLAIRYYRANSENRSREPSQRLRIFITSVVSPMKNFLATSLVGTWR